ncbi:hypothetical protein H9Q72_001198 [Fusarium xylarioides]|uniref:Peptidase S8/S53 domain-containing protein n=1 Tax=Fusarium xylarioides TaxID=221167 RepID=A0A9P7I1U4_9HYPO|nr:hypothetical protein H9Q72_001198 [Fusarium xylarioides]
MQSSMTSEYLDFFGNKEEKPLMHIVSIILDLDRSKADPISNRQYPRHASEADHSGLQASWTSQNVSESIHNKDVTLVFPRLSRSESVGLNVNVIKKSKPENTQLHTAAEFDDTSEARQAIKLEMVKRIYKKHPEYLRTLNDREHSPYLHRVLSSKYKEGKLQNDDVAFFLKDQTLHIQDHDTVLSLLYGKVRGKLEIHLDLYEGQNLASRANAKRDDLITFLEKLEFEEILQYVHIPANPFQSDTSQTHEKQIASYSTSDGVGRRDFSKIFDVLKDKKGVRKIIQLIVDDDTEYPHQDEVIESISEFNVEQLDWRKMDLSSRLLKTAAANATHLHLYSSGKECTLREWSGCDGLNQLPSLRKLNLTIYWRFESRERTKKYAYDFLYRISQNCPLIQSVNIRIEAPAPESQAECYSQRPGDVTLSGRWLSVMKNFTEVLANVQNEIQPRKSVKVAVLDDGFDWPYSAETSFTWTGMTYYIERNADFSRAKPWYFSSAINWAVDQGVHIISMSWTVPDLADTCQALSAAVKRAADSDIIMFASVSDRGAHGDKVESFMGKQKETVICIGGAREAGYVDPSSQPDAKFVFPGECKGIELPLDIDTQKKADTDEFGSSIATALASGFTALLMTLVEMCATQHDFNGITVEKLRERMQKTNNIKIIFRHLLQDLHRDIPLPHPERQVIPVQKYFNWDGDFSDLAQVEKEKNLYELVQNIIPK